MMYFSSLRSAYKNERQSKKNVAIHVLMSSDQEESVVVVLQLESTEKPPLQCATCENVINDEQIRLACGCNHTFCAQCLKSIVQMMINWPALGYPFKCVACQQHVSENLILRVIDEHGLYERFVSCVLPLFWLKDCLQDNEELVSCKFMGTIFDVNHFHRSPRSSRSLLPIYGNSYGRCLPNLFFLLPKSGLSKKGLYNLPP